MGFGRRPLHRMPQYRGQDASEDQEPSDQPLGLQSLSRQVTPPAVSGSAPVFSSNQEIFTVAIKTQHKTIDGLCVYDLAPQSGSLLAVAGPDGYDDPINQDKLPEGFRWVSDTEWESLMLGDEAQKVRADENGVEPIFETC